MKRRPIGFISLPAFTHQIEYFSWTVERDIQKNLEKIHNIQLCYEDHYTVLCFFQCSYIKYNFCDPRNYLHLGFVIVQVFSRCLNTFSQCTRQISIKKFKYWNLYTLLRNLWLSSSCSRDLDAEICMSELFQCSTNTEMFSEAWCYRLANKIRYLWLL